jgi:hypothetical protein
MPLKDISVLSPHPTSVYGNDTGDTWLRLNEFDVLTTTATKSPNNNDTGDTWLCLNEFDVLTTTATKSPNHNDMWVEPEHCVISKPIYADTVAHAR